MRRPPVPILALAAALLFASSLGALLGGVGDDERGPGRRGKQAGADSERTTSSTTSTTPAEGTAAGVAIEAVVPELSKFVEKERQLRFTRAVNVKLLDDAAFREALLGEAEEDTAEIEATEGVLRALSLLEAGVDLNASAEQLVGEGVVGFYDNEKDELTVRGQSVTPYVKLVLVHELTHALEDQHFDLGRDDLGDEAATGFDALVEGSATVIEERYRDTLSRAERRAITKEETSSFDAEAVEDVPEILFTIFGFSYQYGPPLVEAIIERGGMKALDAAFADPPTTTEQVLDPRRYLRRDEPTPVDKPVADGAEIQEGEIGQLALFLILDAHVGRSTALDAARGWDGDRYVAWKDGTRTCVRFTTATDSSDDADELRDAFDDWAEDKGGTTVTGGDRVTVTTCT